jgi:hypothetical protein
LILLKTKVTGIANGYGIRLWDKKIVEENEKKKFLKTLWEENGEENGAANLTFSDRRI